jgi:hypothetical protein
MVASVYHRVSVGVTFVFRYSGNSVDRQHVRTYFQVENLKLRNKNLRMSKI